MNKAISLLDCIEQLNDSVYRAERFGFVPNPFEYRVASVITPRQTGATTGIKSLFDADNDLYVGINKIQSVDFKMSVSKKSNGMLASTISIPDVSLPFYEMCGKSYDGIVWIDVGQYGMFKYAIIIEELILELSYNNKNTKFIIT